MKVFLLFRNPFPYGMAPSQHVTCEAIGLKEAGADVEVIIFVPPLDKTKDNGLPAKGIFRNVPYNYIHGKFRPSNIVGQIFSRFWNTIKTFFWGLHHFKKGDVVYSYGGDNTTLMLLTWAAHLNNAKIVVELVEIPFYNLALINKLRRRFDTKILFPYFDAFVCISHSLIDFTMEYVPYTTPIHLMPILVEEISQNQKRASQYKVPYIIHTGTMAEQKDSISYILKGFAEFKKNDKTGCRLVFTGPMSDPKSCRWKNMIEDLGISDSVDLLGMIASRDEVLSLQKNASMSIVYKMENIQTKYCFATKIGEILMAGVPLIATNATEQRHYLRHRENAMLVEPGDIKGLADIIHYVLTHKEKARIIGIRGRQLAETEFNPTLQGKKLYEFFKKL